MNIHKILEYFSQYGILIIFLFIFLEYMNMPGLPAGVIMPSVGVMVSSSNMNFFLALVVSIMAGLLGSIVLYFIGMFAGNKLLNYMIKKFPKTKKTIDKAKEFTDKYGNKGVFIGRIIPIARTLVSIPAGIAKLDLKEFIIYSTLGITIWNVVFISIGYFFSDLFLK